MSDGEFIIPGNWIVAPHGGNFIQVLGWIWQDGGFRPLIEGNNYQLVVAEPGPIRRLSSREQDIPAYMGNDFARQGGGR